MKLLRPSHTMSPVRRLCTNSQRRLSVHPDSGSKHVQVESVDSAGIITINRPQNMNCINAHMLQKMYKAVVDIEKDKKLLIIKGIPNCFSSGGDLKAFLGDTPIDKLVTLPLSAVTAIRYLEYHGHQVLHTYRIPYVSLIDGVAMGAGLGMAMNARYRVATERTLLAMPENKFGYMVDSGMTYFFSRLPLRLGIYLGVTGSTIGGKNLLKSGLVTNYVNSERLPELEASLAKCTNDSEIGAALNHHSVRVDHGTSIIDNIDHIEKCFVPDTIENIIERLEKVQTDWSRKVLKTIGTLSPGSMKTTLRSLRHAAGLSYAECLRMEYRVIINSCRFNHDVVTGIREIFVNKNKVKKWNPATLEQVDEAYVESYFEPVPPQNELQLRA